MRSTTMAQIDALHAQIADLIEAEKLHYDVTHPHSNQLWRHVEHTRIEQFAHSPQHRALMREVTASLPQPTKQ